jgi:hypothetical protein
MVRFHTHSSHCSLLYTIAIYVSRYVTDEIRITVAVDTTVLAIAIPRLDFICQYPGAMQPCYFTWRTVTTNAVNFSTHISSDRPAMDGRGSHNI